MKLYPHQIEALDAVKDHNRCAIYYDMGLGKTYIGSEKLKAIGAMVNLIVCQKSKIGDWIEHFKQNYWPSTVVYNLTINPDLLEFCSINKNGMKAYSGYHSKNVVEQVIGIINYDLIWRRPELLKLTNFTLMLDESSLITNRLANRSKFILKLNPTNVILLSGTPTSGKYEKLWSQLSLLGWEIKEDAFWKSYVDYKWVERGGFWDKKVNGYKNVDHLKKRLAQFGAIFKKTNEVMDLPEQVEQIIYLEPDKKYKRFKKNHYIEIYQGPDKEPIELMGDTVLSKILYERQLCGQYSEAKLEAFKDLLESTEERLIVFYNFNNEVDKLCKIVEDAGRRISLVNGKVKSLNNYESYDDSVTFVQYQAGAYGLNLQKANKVIYFTLPLGVGSCDLWEQSKKRIHRIGQDKTCFYYYLITKNSIEEWNLDLLRKGSELTDELFKESKGKH